MRAFSMMAAALLVPVIVGAQVAPVAATDEARPISLEEAVRLAQRNAPEAVRARGELRQTSAAVRSAYAAFLPSVNLSLAGSQRGGEFIGEAGRLVPAATDWTYSSGIGLGLDVFDGQRLFNVRRARMSVAAADANEILQRFNVSLAVKREYFAVLAARESEAAARSQLEQAQQQMRVASARVAAGAATKSDSLRSVILVGNARLALLTAQNNLRVANAALTRLVAAPDLVTAEPVLDTLATDIIPLDSAELVRLAERGPAVDQAAAAERAAVAAVRAARSTYLPTVNVQYQRGGGGNDPRFGLGDNPYAYSDVLRFGVNLPLFNQWQREEQIARAKVAEDIAEATLRDTRLQAQQSLTQFLGAMQTAQQRVEIQLASVAAAEEDLRVQQQRYALSASTLLDVLTSQTQLDAARAALIQARYDYRVARAQLEALIGRDL